MGIIVKTLPLLALLSACVGNKSQDSEPSGSDSGDSSGDSVGDSGDSGPSPYDDADGDGFTYWDADCDDTDPNTHPGAAEAAGDGVDSDCDGLDGSAENMYTSATLVMTGVEERPNFGESVALPGDVNGDGSDDMLIVGGVLGDPDSAEYYTSEVFLLFGPFDSEMTLTDATRWLPLVMQPTVAAAGDLDNDGLADFMIGSWQYNSSATDAGQVWIVYGAKLGQGTENMVEDLEDSISATEAVTHFGSAASGGGDLNGDGMSDLMIGGMRGSAEDPGVAFVFDVPIIGAILDTDATLRMDGVYATDMTGRNLSWAGDVNGDGHDDMAISAPSSYFAADTRGHVYLVYGPREGTMSLEDADATIQGEVVGGYFGHAISRAGDANNDGLEDLIVGAPLTDAEGQRSGRAWLFSGPLEGTYVASDADATFLSAGELDWTGYDVESAGDVNNDGFDDVLITSPQQYRYVPSRLARVSLFYGPLDGELTPDDADRVWASPYPHDTAGRSIAVGGDLNADGRRDLVVGAPYDDEGGYEAGAVYLLTLE